MNQGSHHRFIGSGRFSRWMLGCRRILSAVKVLFIVMLVALLSAQSAHAQAFPHHGSVAPHDTLIHSLSGTTYAIANPPVFLSVNQRPSNTVTEDLSSSLGTVPPDIQKIMDRGSLVVALLDTDNPPFFMGQEGDRLDGLDVKIARDLANRLGVDVTFNRSATTFNEVVDTVFNQNADIAISKISRTMNRIQRVRFSEPYLRMRQGLLVNRLRLAQQTNGRSVPETIRALEGNVGVIKGSSYVGFLQQKFPNASIVEYPSWDAIIQAVNDGEILAAYRDELEIKKVVRSSPDAALQLETIALTDTEDPIAMVLPWTSTHLLAMVDQYLDTEKLNYSADTVLEAYAAYFTN